MSQLPVKSAVSHAYSTSPTSPPIHIILTRLQHRQHHMARLRQAHRGDNGHDPRGRVVHLPAQDCARARWQGIPAAQGIPPAARRTVIDETTYCMHTTLPLRKMYVHKTTVRHQDSDRPWFLSLTFCSGVANGVCVPSYQAIVFRV